MIMHANDYLQNSKEKSVLLLSAGFITEFTNSHYEKIKVGLQYLYMHEPSELQKKHNKSIFYTGRV